MSSDAENTGEKTSTGNGPVQSEHKRLGPPVACLDAPRTADPVTVLIIADPHLSVDGWGTWKVRHRTEARLSTALDVAHGTGGFPSADAVIFAGDLTHDGRPAEFNLFDHYITDLSVPWTAIPGNHDVPKSFDNHDGPSIATFCERYAGDADASAYPFGFDIGEIRVVCLNTAAPADADTSDTWGGAVGPAQRERLRALLAAGPDIPTVVVGHHNFGTLPEHEAARPWTRFPADDAPALRRIFDSAGVSLAVTGHHHVPAVRDHGSFTEIMAPAICSFPQAALALRIAPAGTTARLVPLTDPTGVTEAYWHAATGAILGQGILQLTTTRLPRLHSDSV